MDKLRSTLKQFVRDWSQEVNYNSTPLSAYVTLACVTGTRGTGNVLYTNEGRAGRAFLGQTISAVKVSLGSNFFSLQCDCITPPDKTSGCSFLVQALAGWLMMLLI
jgi:hypothetical protein